MESVIPRGRRYHVRQIAIYRHAKGTQSSVFPVAINKDNYHLYGQFKIKAKPIQPHSIIRKDDQKGYTRIKRPKRAY